MLKLFPRLPVSVATPIARAVGALSVTAAREQASTEHVAASYAPTGGVRVSKAELGQLADSVRTIASACGYPQARSIAATDNFDAKLGQLLHMQSGLTATEGCRDEVWNFLGCVLLPDVIRWRFPGEETKEHNFLGLDRGLNHALGRCWWGAELLRDDDAPTTPYELLFLLGVDEVVGFVRRSAAVANTDVAVAIAHAVHAVQKHGIPFPRTDLFRDVMKQFLRRGAVVSYESLAPVELRFEMYSLAVQSAIAIAKAKGLQYKPPAGRVYRHSTAKQLARVEELRIGELLRQVSLSSRSPNRFAELRDWLAQALSVPQEAIGIKYLADRKNYRNRIGEALRHQPALLLLLHEGDAEGVREAVADRLQTSRSTVAALCSPRTEGGAEWDVTTLLAATDLKLNDATTQLFGNAHVQRVAGDRTVAPPLDPKQVEKFILECWRKAFKNGDGTLLDAIRERFALGHGALRSKTIVDGRNIGNRLSEGLGAGCQVLVLGVEGDLLDASRDEALRQLEAARNDAIVVLLPLYAERDRSARPHVLSIASGSQR